MENQRKNIFSDCHPEGALAPVGSKDCANKKTFGKRFFMRKAMSLNEAKRVPTQQSRMIGGIEKFYAVSGIKGYNDMDSHACLRQAQNDGCGDNGRSMVEMLGVLAIIGVLSIGGIAGYTMAMNRYKANQLIDLAGQISIAIQSAAVNADFNLWYQGHDIMKSLGGSTSGGGFDGQISSYFDNYGVVIDAYENGSILINPKDQDGVRRALASILSNSPETTYITVVDTDS